MTKLRISLDLASIDIDKTINVNLSKYVQRCFPEEYYKMGPNCREMLNDIVLLRNLLKQILYKSPCEFINGLKLCYREASEESIFKNNDNDCYEIMHYILQNAKERVYRIEKTESKEESEYKYIDGKCKECCNHKIICCIQNQPKLTWLKQKFTEMRVYKLLSQLRMKINKFALSG
jgi:hypothetical protein